MTTQFNTPPLVEVICEINYQNSDWDLTFPAEFYNRIKSEYPQKNTITQDSVNLALSSTGINVINDTNKIQILQCKNTSNDIIIEFTQNKIVVRAIKPKMGWEVYKNVITEIDNHYFNVVNNRLALKITLKYINIINVGDNHSYSNLKKYFNYYPYLDITTDEEINSVQNLCEIPFTNYDSVLAIQQATLKPDKNNPAPTVLDLGFIKYKNTKEITLEDWLNEAHKQIKNAFFASITNNAKIEFTK